MKASPSQVLAIPARSGNGNLFFPDLSALRVSVGSFSYHHLSLRWTRFLPGSGTPWTKAHQAKASSTGWTNIFVALWSLLRTF